MSVMAAFYTGDRHFSVERVEPRPPGAGEVEIDVAYCGICGTDLHVFHGAMDARVGKRRVIGHEMSGTVARVGEGVAGFTPGEAVVVRPLKACGTCPACAAGHGHVCHNLKFLGLDTDGAFQEKWTVPAETLHKLPAGMSLKAAALIEPVAVACHDVRRARLVPGETALVVGGGPIGMLIAMVARQAGAEVVLAEINDRRLAFAEGQGIRTLDPKRVDVAAEVTAMTGGKGADVVFEVSGSQPGVDLTTAAAATRGRIVMVAIHTRKAEVDLFRYFWRELELIGARVYEPADYEAAIALVASGAIAAETLVTDVRGLEAIEEAFAALDQAPNAMKSLIRCGTEGVR
jgi:(R,R)-butanediol dehydrogenase/meso-butanediol dehydrogenase/diacetyl reductase